MDNLTRKNRPETLFKKYANLILNLGINLKPNDYLLISALVFQRDFVLYLVKEAYRLGAAYVDVFYQDEKLSALAIQYAENNSLNTIPESYIAPFKELLRRGGSYLALSGSEDPFLFRGLPQERQASLLLSKNKALDFFYQQIYRANLKWCVAGVASPARAKAMFPHLKADEAEAKLWEIIFKICGLESKDPLAFWEEKLEKIEKRKKWLGNLQIKTLFFKSPTCDLEVSLHSSACWKGGYSFTVEGSRFLANLPTEEVFTVPFYPSVKGYFISSRPVFYKNIFLEKLELSFKNGELIKINASQNLQEIKAIINENPANRRLGEIALVDSVSELANSSPLYYDLLYDENTACHAALGAAYLECLPGIEKLNSSEWEKLGFNSSSIHIDVMFGSPELEVSCLAQSGRRELIMQKGKFLI